MVTRLLDRMFPVGTVNVPPPEQLAVRPKGIPQELKVPAQPPEPSPYLMDNVPPDLLGLQLTPPQPVEPRYFMDVVKSSMADTEPPPVGTLPVTEEQPPYKSIIQGEEIRPVGKA